MRPSFKKLRIVLVVKAGVSLARYKDGSKQPLDKLCRVNWSTLFEINLANNFTYTKFA